MRVRSRQAPRDRRCRHSSVGRRGSPAPPRRSHRRSTRPRRRPPATAATREARSRAARACARDASRSSSSRRSGGDEMGSHLVGVPGIEAAKCCPAPTDRAPAECRPTPEARDPAEAADGVPLHLAPGRSAGRPRCSERPCDGRPSRLPAQRCGRSPWGRRSCHCGRSLAAHPARRAPANCPDRSVSRLLPACPRSDGRPGGAGPAARSRWDGRPGGAGPATAGGPRSDAHPAVAGPATAGGPGGTVALGPPVLPLRPISSRTLPLQSPVLPAATGMLTSGPRGTLTVGAAVLPLRPIAGRTLTLRSPVLPRLPPEC